MRVTSPNTSVPGYGAYAPSRSRIRGTGTAKPVRQKNGFCYYCE